MIVALLIALGVLTATTATRSPLRCATARGPAKADGKRDKAAEKPEQEPRVPIDFELEALGSVQVCVAARGEALVDCAGARRGHDRAVLSGERRYRVDLPGGGAVRVSGRRGGAAPVGRRRGELGGQLERDREIDYAGPDCP